MCTLIAAVRSYPTHPLVVAANRDERLDRPATGPRLWPGPPPFIAPRDERAGGTWLGVTQAGMFVGVTNRFGVEVDPKRDSRGQLVVEALGAASAEALHRQLGELSPRRFNAFHLFYADRDAAFVTWSDGTTVRQETLGPGLHVITERSLGGDDRARTERIRAAYPKGTQAPEVAELGALLRMHAEDDPVGSTCVHLPAFNYGTRSSFVYRLGAARSELWASEGAPHETQLEDRGALLEQLTLRLRSG